MNIKTSLLEKYVKFVDSTKKQNKNFKTNLFLIAKIIFLLMFFLLFEQLK